MATVGLSAKLCAQIIENATAPFLQAKTNTIKAIAEDDQLYRLFCAALRPESELETAQALPLIWTNKYNTQMNIYYKGMCFKLVTTNRPCPVASWTESKFNFDESTEDPKVYALRQRFLELYKPYERAVADEKELTYTLQNVFEECPNLNRALEVLPSIGNWIDSTTRQRLAHKLEPRAKRRTAEEIKNSVLTPEALAAMARARTLDPNQS
jgi:hypothetical protein